MTTLSNTTHLTSYRTIDVITADRSQTRRHKQTLAILASSTEPTWVKLLAVLGFNPVRQRALRRLSARG